MNETVILVSLIVGFFAITIFALVALLVVRRREQTRQDSKGIDDAIARMDSALDSALVEINKIGTLVKKEIDEKYQAILFLYDLVDNKKKEIEAIDPSEIDTTVLAQYLENHVSELKLVPKDDVVNEGINPIDVLLNRDTDDSDFDTLEDDFELLRPRFSNAKHAKIWNMRQQGKNISEIAKELGMGKGEVKLILDLAKRTV